MSEKFRTYHLFQIMNSFDVHKGPLDGFLRSYFRMNKSIGSKDRKWIGDSVYSLIRWRGLLEHLSPPPISWEKKWEILKNRDSSALDQKLPPHIRVSFPLNLFKILEEHFGVEKAIEIGLASNTTAPTTLRINSLKTSRKKMLLQLQQIKKVRPCSISPYGIILEERCDIRDLEAFKEGCIEIQDEGSQIAADLVQANPGDWVLDLCAGAGGKALSVGAKMENRGQLFLYDIRQTALMEAKKRFNRAGITNVQFLKQLPPNYKGRMHWVIADVPCSGTGTLRRNPDIKWRFSEELLNQYVQTQEKIFEEALSFVRPGGKVVYITCSLLPQENEQQVEKFLKKHPISLEADPFRSITGQNLMDGFFTAVFKKERLLS